MVLWRSFNALVFKIFVISWLLFQLGVASLFEPGTGSTWLLSMSCKVHPKTLQLWAISFESHCQLFSLSVIIMIMSELWQNGCVKGNKSWGPDCRKIGLKFQLISQFISLIAAGSELFKMSRHIPCTTEEAVFISSSNLPCRLCAAGQCRRVWWLLLPMPWLPLRRLRQNPQGASPSEHGGARTHFPRGRTTGSGLALVCVD